MPFHAFLLVGVPPTAAELHLAGDAALKISNHGRKREVVHEVVVVENGLGQLLVLIEAVEELGERRGLGPVADGVAADVRADGLKEAGVVVALWADVQLHGPAACGITTAKVEHEVSTELFLLCGRDGVAGASFVENVCGLGLAREVRIGVREAVVAEAGAERVEIVDAFLECGKETGQGGGVASGSGGELVGPRVKQFGLVNAPGFVRAEGGIDFRADAERGDGLVMGERLSGVIGGAKGADVELLQDAVHGQLGRGERGVGGFPDFLGGRFIEQGIDAEVAA